MKCVLVYGESFLPRQVLMESFINTTCNVWGCPNEWELRTASVSVGGMDQVTAVPYGPICRTIYYYILQLTVA